MFGAVGAASGSVARISKDLVETDDSMFRSKTRRRGAPCASRWILPSAGRDATLQLENEAAHSAARPVKTPIPSATTSHT